MWSPAQRSDELYHHGILGQKWGVRRYQNKDGSLTPLGKQKLEKYKYNIQDEFLSGRPMNDKYKKAGISKGDADYDVIKRGTSIQRVANSGEPNDSKRKYVSILEDDNANYLEMWEAIGLDPFKPVSTYKYEAIKDLKVANAQTVLKDSLDKYGNKKIKNIFEDAKDLGVLKSHQIETNGDKWEKKYWEQSQKARTKFLQKTMKKSSREMLDYYKKKGYDAIVDTEDWYTGLAEYPVIVLDPSKSMKLKKEQKWD